MGLSTPERDRTQSIKLVLGIQRARARSSNTSPERNLASEKLRSPRIHLFPYVSLKGVSLTRNGGKSCGFHAKVRS